MIKSTWTTVKLGECFRIKHGYAFKGEFFGDEGPHVLLTPGNFNEDGGLKLKGEKEKYYSGPIPKEFILGRGDLLVAMTDLKQSAPILGSAAIVPKSDLFLHNQRLGKIVKLDERRLTKQFLYYLFNSAGVRAQIKGSATGTTVRHTAPERIYNVGVALPPIKTQYKIARTLSNYDDLIKNNTRRIKILEEMARALYLEWFVHFRFPGHEKLSRIASALGEIPESWTVKKIGDVCESVNYGYTASAVTNAVGPKFLRITDVVPDVIDWPTVPFCEIAQDSAMKYILNEGDIVVARTGATTGYAKRLNKLHPRTVFASYLVRVRANSEVSNLMLGILIESDEYKRFIKRNIGGAAQPNANAVVLTSMQLAVPPPSIGEAFDNLVSPIIDEAELLAVKNQSLRRTRDLLLPRLISGEVSVEPSA